MDKRGFFTGFAEPVCGLSYLCLFSANSMSKPTFINSKVVYHDNSTEFNIDARGKDLASVIRACQTDFLRQVLRTLVRRSPILSSSPRKPIKSIKSLPSSKPYKNPSSAEKTKPAHLCKNCNLGKTTDTSMLIITPALCMTS